MVYSGINKIDNLEYAIKLLQIQKEEDKISLENEFNILSEFSSKGYWHPNIIPIYGLYKLENII